MKREAINVMQRPDGLMMDDHSELNFNRYLFINNNILYSYGGEGKFNSFPWLIYFDFNCLKIQ